MTDHYLHTAPQMAALAAARPVIKIRDASMNAIAHPIFVTASSLAARTKRSFQRAVQTVVDARMRRARHELEFRRSFDAYREGKSIPPLNEDLRTGS